MLGDTDKGRSDEKNFSGHRQSIGLNGLGGASFDCLKASNEIERKICANPALSLLDDELASAYRAAGLVS